jgi:peptidoglycan-associated lipoprotein
MTRTNPPSPFLVSLFLIFCVAVSGSAAAKKGKAAAAAKAPAKTSKSAKADKKSKADRGRENTASRKPSARETRAERAAADSGFARDIASLRTDLQALRTEFGAKVAVLENGMRFAFPVNFGYDDATVRDEDRMALERFAQVAQRHYNGAMVTVEGFADPAGSARYNEALSLRRAEAVRDFLAAQGLPADRVRPVGYGETRLVVPGAERSEPGAEKNRRVVFVIEDHGATNAAMPVAVVPRGN